MKRPFLLPLSAAIVACGMVFAGAGFGSPAWAQLIDQSVDANNLAGPFARAATYPVYENVPAGTDPASETVAEISDVTPDGNTMIYTDAAGKRIGFVDISDPNTPKGTGTVSVAELGNADDQPTSVAVTGEYVLVVIDETGGNFTQPRGRVDVLRLSDRERVGSFDLGGQPDSIAISDDGEYAAIAIENQRDEDLGDAGLPQLPSGFVQTIKLTGTPAEWATNPVYFTDEAGAPLPSVAQAGLDTPEDLEPEYVSFNSRGHIAVTLQENNGIAIIDAATGGITSVFSAGSVELTGIDNEKDGVINPLGSQPGVVREPDAVVWLDDDHLATANEGDWKGGSRGWSVFDTAGNAVWDAGNSIEEIARQHGLHNEDRAGKKGPEIEGIATATMGGTRYAFVGSERSNFVAVYNVDNPAQPEFVQLLFTTNGPEGLLPIPERQMLAVSSETDEAKNGVRSAVNLFELDGAQPKVAQPSIVSNLVDGQYVGWTALGALSADPTDPAKLFAASDAALAHAQVYTIDTSHTPALITEARTVTRAGAPAEGLDIEGVAARENGGFWLASEGKTGAENTLVRTNANLDIEDEVTLPAQIADHVGKWGLEGVDTHVNQAGEELVYFALQRPLWQDPNAAALTAVEGENTVRIGQYNTTTEEFAWFSYELTGTDASGDWMGLSELTVIDDDTLAVIERDKLNGPDAAVKRIMKVSLPGSASPAAGQVPAASGANANAAPSAETTVTPVGQATAIDVLPYLRATNGWTQEKLEGFTVAADGQMYAVTDNDGLANATGETVFLRLGHRDQVFGTGAEEEPETEVTATPEPTDAPTDGASAQPSQAPSQVPTQPGEDSTRRGEDFTTPDGDDDVQNHSDSNVDDGPNDSGTKDSNARNKTGQLPRTGVNLGLGLAVAVSLVAVGALTVRVARKQGES